MNGNSIKTISDNAFKGLSVLPYLDLSDQGLAEIGNDGFVGLSQLTVLNLSKNKITMLKSEWFLTLKELVELYLTDNDLSIIDPLLYNLLSKIDILHTSQKELCCMTTRKLLCLVDKIETSAVCNRAIPYTAVRAVGIFLCITIIITNLIVIYLRLVSNKRNVNSLTIANLAISDTIQGFALGSVITNDLLYNAGYALTKWEWRNGFLCSIVGFLFPLTSANSAISTILIALDWYTFIVTPFAAVTEGRGIKTRIYIILGTWVCCSCLLYVPSLPLTRLQTKQFVPSDICFIHLYDNVYSLKLSIYVNMIYGVVLPIAYCFVIGIYVRMVYILRISISSISRPDTATNYYNMYVRLTLVCLMNMISSVTTALITYVADARVPMDTSIIDSILLIIISFNAALNPFLYTFATSFMAEYCKSLSNVPGQN